MATAVWNDVVLASGPYPVRFEGRDYFPPAGVRWEHLLDMGETRWRWRVGRVCVLSLAVDDQMVTDAAWYHPAPRWGLRRIQDHVAFCDAVTITAASR
jgi:uncharacterized protein (DUF427 family)